ncbi:hypothetical protein [Acidiphilium sp. MT5]
MAIRVIASIFEGFILQVQSWSNIVVTPTLITRTLIGAGLFFVVFTVMMIPIERRRARKYAKLPPLDLTLPARNPDP